LFSIKSSSQCGKNFLISKSYHPHATGFIN
jgi:hypothetical protein